MFSLLRTAGSPIITNTNVYRIAAKSYSNELSDKELCALQGSWKKVQKKSKEAGVMFFTELFKKHPETVKFFKKFGECPDDILCNDKFIKDHAVGNVMCTLGKFIKKMDDPCEVDKLAKDLGKKHVKYCVSPKNFKDAKGVLLKVVEKMDCGIDCDGKKAWDKSLKVILGGMAKGLK